MFVIPQEKLNQNIKQLLNKLKNQILFEVYSGAQLAGGRGRSLLPFFKNRKKSAMILEKSTLFECIYELISHLKCHFQGYLGEKTPKFFPAGLCFCSRTWHVYRSAPIPTNFSCLGKFLVARLIFFPIKQVKLRP